MSTGEIYAEGRERITALLAGIDAAAAVTQVPTCPAWTVHDVLAHVVGVCADILAGRLDGVATDAWTDAQVQARKGATVEEMLAEWSETAPQVEALADQFPGRVGDQWIADATTHEHDLRSALNVPGARDSRGLSVGLDFLVTEGLSASIVSRGLPPLRVEAGETGWTLGDGEAAASVSASPFELFRAFTGRRSLDQVRAYDWEGDAGPFLAALEYGPFTPSPGAIIE